MHGHNTNPQKSTPAKIAAVVEETTTTSVVTNQTTALTPKNVLNYLKELPTDEYQQMAKAWEKMTMEEDFSQA